MIAEQIADALTPSEALRLFPGRPSLQSLNRWILKGVAGPDGQRLRLKSIKVAGRRYITREAVAEFIAASNADPSHELSQKSAIAAAVDRGAAADAALRALGY